MIHTTLLELVVRGTEVTRDGNATVASVLGELRTGRARLTGNFRGVPVEELDPAGRFTQRIR